MQLILLCSFCQPTGKNSEMWLFSSQSELNSSSSLKSPLAQLEINQSAALNVLPFHTPVVLDTHMKAGSVVSKHYTALKPEMYLGVKKTSNTQPQQFCFSAPTFFTFTPFTITARNTLGCAESSRKIKVSCHKWLFMFRGIRNWTWDFVSEKNLQGLKLFPGFAFN